MQRLLLITVSILLVACKANHVSVRLKNCSAQDFKKITVSIAGTTKTFENLKQGDVSEAFLVDHAYRYCFTSIVTDTDTFQFRPVDFVGEHKFTRGKILMKFDIENSRITIKTRRRFSNPR